MIDPVLVAEISIVAIAALSFIAGGVLLLFGYRISKDFGDLNNRVVSLEISSTDRHAQLRSLRATSAVVASLLAESVVLHEVSRRVLLDVIPAGNLRDQFEYMSAKHAEQLGRTDLYVRLLDPENDRLFDDELAELAEKFPDSATVNFLESVKLLLDEQQAIRVDDILRSLRIRVFGVDYTKWTGRRIS